MGWVLLGYKYNGAIINKLIIMNKYLIIAILLLIISIGTLVKINKSYRDKLEISNENNEMMIQIYCCDDKDYWEFSLEEFQKIVEEAKQQLIAVG